MAYKRKTEDVYGLFYDYGYGDGLEEISVCSTWHEAVEDRKSYILNEGICPRIKKYRVKINNKE